MYTSNTIGDYPSLRKVKTKRIGARLDYKLSKDLNELDIDEFTKDLQKFCSSSGIQLSGFGYTNYSGILSSTRSERVFRNQIIGFKEWLIIRKNTVKLLRLGKVQNIDDIFYE